MASKNDISSFKTLPKNKKVVETAVKEKAVQQTKRAAKKVVSMGRPPKPKAEKEIFRIAFSLTQKEADILLKKSGSLSHNIFIKNFIREQTDLLDL